MMPSAPFSKKYLQLKHLAFLSSLVVSLILAELNAIASAQIIPDQTLPHNSITSSQEDITEISGGTAAGSNLFHSFEQFSLPEGNIAWFNHAANINNIFSRITGNSISQIDGLIQANGTANLFLINPNGIIFGENAALDIGGSFISSTAESIIFADQHEFSAVTPQASALLTVSIPVGLQYGTDNGNLMVAGSGNQLQFNPNFTVNRNSRPPGLEVNQGKTLALIGGNILLDGGNLTAPGGNIELGSVADNQLVQFELTESNLNFDYAEVNSFKDINLANATSLEVSGMGGGSVQIQGKEVIITDGSAILADTVGGIDGGDININAAELLVVAGTAAELPFISRLSTDIAPTATGNGGDIALNSANIIITDGAQVISSSYGKGDTGNIKVNTDYLELFSGSPILNSSGLFTLVFGTGNGGDIDINANKILVSGGAQAATLTFSQGNGGDLLATAKQIELVGKSPGTSPSAFLVNVEAGATGDGGQLRIDTESLVIKDGARAAILTLGSGDAGILDIKAQEIQLSSGAPGTGASGIFSNVEAGATGNGGQLKIDTESLSIDHGAQIAITTFGAGNSGLLSLTAEEINLAGISPAGNPSGLFSNVEATATGTGGEIQINAEQLNLTDGAQVAATNFGLGEGGTIEIEANEIKLLGGAANTPSGFFSAVAPTALGDGGSLGIKTASLKVIDGGQIAVSTAGSGKGGELAITAKEIELIGRSEFGASGIFGNTILSNGDGGNLEIYTDSLSILDGATISASNFSSTNSEIPPGEGQAGNIQIEAQTLDLDTKSNIPSRITASTNNHGGGNIELTISERVTISNDSEIDADTRGQAENAIGGNIHLSTNDLFLNSQGRISVDSTGSGKAGNIEIQATNIDANEGRITATSKNSGGGDLDLIADVITLASSELSTSVSDGTGGGGNLEIKSDFVILKDQSNIIAKANRGDGGNINIATDVFLMSADSLVDASSQSGIDGAVRIKSPDLDRQLGVVQFSTKVTDPTALIAAVCPKDEVNTLSTIGKGGLAENPSQNLRGQSVWEDLRDFSDLTNDISTSAASPKLIEAKAWNINAHGQVKLVSSLPLHSQPDYWTLFNRCRK